MAILDDFKKFAFKGNLIDLAVGFVIGTAFSTVVKSLVSNIIMPAISYVTPGQSYKTWHSGKIMWGLFASDVLNFFIIAVSLFIIVVLLLGAIMKAMEKPKEEEAATTKDCPFCCTSIPIKATRCPQCTSELSDGSIGSESVIA